MEKINLGRVEVIFREASPNRSGQTVESRPQMLSLEEAQKLAGFKIWQPTSLPFSDLEIVQVLVISLPQSDKVINTILKYKDNSQHWIAIEQRPIPDEKEGKRQVFIAHEIWKETVQNRPVAFYTHSVKASDHANGQVNILHSLWEYEDSLIDLQSAELTTEQQRHIILS